jgi:hypothetical protein
MVVETGVRKQKKEAFDLYIIPINGFAYMIHLFQNLSFDEQFISKEDFSHRQNTAQQSVHWTLGILPPSQAVFYALSFSTSDGFVPSAPARVTQTVSPPTQNQCI